jgi:predicted double-glycine peptidase
VRRWGISAGGRVCAAALALVAQAGPAAAASPDAKQVRSLLELRNDRLVRQHWDLSCGAAALATLLTYQLGMPVSEKEAALGMLRRGDPKLVRARFGFSLLDLKRFAASRGLAAEGYAQMNLDDLLAVAPAIAPIQVRGFPHFVVVRARRGDRILIGDPAYGNRTMAASDFDKAWVSRIGFVVHPPGEPRPPNRMGAGDFMVMAVPPAALRASDSALRAGGL